MTTKIEWTDKGETWNPLAGCSKISDGCKNCYAIKDAVRLAGNPNPKIAEKYKGTAKTENGKMNWTGKINFASKETLTQPMRWTRPRKIFVNSMSDLFHESVPDEWIDRIFAVMALSPQHTFQILTKRPDRMKKYFEYEAVFERILAEATFLDWGVEFQRQFKRIKRQMNVNTFPLPNVWLGVSVEIQKETSRLDFLRDTPAAIRFVSFEPLLENLGKINLTDIHWAIIGGESGTQARPCNVQWIRYLVEQCKYYEIPVFVKQLGAKPYQQHRTEEGYVLQITDTKGGVIEEFPADLQIREFPKNLSSLND